MPKPWIHNGITTDHHIAIDSNDLYHPWGSIRNNVNPRMVSRILGLIPNASLLDLGCAGGGFVREMIEAGSFAVGIDGTDHPLRPDSESSWGDDQYQYFFTADITKPFTVNALDGFTRQFDVVTMFEVWEHLPERYLHAVLDNINEHTHDKSICIFSASNDASVHEGVELHVTKQNREWWVGCFGQRGWVESELQSEFTYDDFRPWVGPSTMHFVLEKAAR